MQFGSILFVDDFEEIKATAPAVLSLPNYRFVRIASPVGGTQSTLLASKDFFLVSIRAACPPERFSFGNAN